MRTILFRGKRIDNGENHEWVYGSYAEWGRVQHVIITKGLYGHNNSYEVASETVGQYTGLEDYQNRKIFEGDIVKLTDVVNDFSWFAVVCFGNPNCQDNWGWQLEPIGKCECATEILLWIDMEDTGAYCEVIGNIYDNPELLEVKTNE